MAEGKKSFVLYTDLIHTVKKMPKDKAADLFIHILDYVNDNDPETDDLIIQLTFEPIKQQLKRDLVKWEALQERNKINGSKGGRPRKQGEPKKPSGLSGNPTKPKKGVSVSVSVNDSVTVNDNVIKKSTPPTFEEFKAYALEKEPNVNIKALELKYESWKVNNWKTGKDKKITNWKSTLLNTLPHIDKVNAPKPFNHPSILPDKKRNYDRF